MEEKNSASPGELGVALMQISVISNSSSNIQHVFFSPSYKTMSGSSQYKFGVLAKIVKHMKARHLDGDDHPLTLEEILDETNQLDVGSKVRQVGEHTFILFQCLA